MDPRFALGRWGLRALQALLIAALVGLVALLVWASGTPAPGWSLAVLAAVGLVPAGGLVAAEVEIHGRRPGSSGAALLATGLTMLLALPAWGWAVFWSESWAS